MDLPNFQHSLSKKEEESQQPLSFSAFNEEDFPNAQNDFISMFLSYTEGLPTPHSFRLWAAIGGVAAAMERRVWMRSSRYILYPNLFTLLVAPPGVGKSVAISSLQEIIYAAKANAMGKGINIAPQSITKASLVDALKSSAKRLMRPTGSMLEYHSLFIAAGEFGVLLPAHDLEFLSTLNTLYDNERVYWEKRRGNNLDIEIIGPQINILAGSQPGFLSSILPEEAWSMGFTSRLLMIYGATSPYVSIFKHQEPRKDLELSLIKTLQACYQHIGEMTWDPDAEHAAEQWIEGGCQPETTHSKLQHYAPRRKLMVLKLAMISAMSHGQRMSISLLDFLRAKDWLLNAEAVMPDVFRDMVGKSDSQILQEMHFFLWGIYAKDKKPIHEARVINFLSNRVPSEKIRWILEVAEKSNIVSKSPLGMYTPRPKHEHGEE